MTKTRFLFFPAMLILAIVRCAFAQNVSGTIVGSVTDASGASITAAVVTLINEQTNIQVKAATETGEFVAANLPVGIYTVKAELPGFRPGITTGVRLLAARTARVDIVLEPGAITQTVEVQASAPVINSESATLGTILEASTIGQLPLNGRTLDRLVRFAPGVTSDSASNPRVAGSAYWGGIQFSVDGTTYNDMGNGGGAYSYRNGLSTLPSIDAISEFKLDTNGQKAEDEGA